MCAMFYLFYRFEIAIFILIFLNMVSMGIEHYNQSRVVTFTLEISNALFTTIFSLGEKQFLCQVSLKSWLSWLNCQRFHNSFRHGQIILLLFGSKVHKYGCLHCTSEKTAETVEKKWIFAALNLTLVNTWL